MTADHYYAPTDASRVIGRVTGQSSSGTHTASGSPPCPPIRQSVQLPFDILDHIFSFLSSHPKVLLACSKAHPFLSHIVERYRFRHIIVHTGVTNFTYSFKPSDLLRHLAETPRIVKYVSVFQIEFNHDGYGMQPDLEEIASLLPMFPVLKSIMFPTRRGTSFPEFWWQEDFPLNFRTAVEKCFQLPTLQEVHIGNLCFPLSILDNHANINYVSLSGCPKFELESETSHPQIKFLSLVGFEKPYSEVFVSWAKRHIVGLKSLKYDISSHSMISQVLGICSETLENLYIYCHYQEQVDVVDLSLIPHLRHLTIHAVMFAWSKGSWSGPMIPRSFLSASSLQQLTIEIFVEIWYLDCIDLSPLRILTESPVRFPYIDLYMYTGSARLDCRITRTRIVSALAKHEGLMELVEQGVLVIHPEETAPTLSRSFVAKDDRSCII